MPAGGASSRTPCAASPAARSRSACGLPVKVMVCVWLLDLEVMNMAFVRFVSYSTKMPSTFFENGDNSPLNVKLSRDELAAVVGTATETLVRTIADLKREKLISTDKKKIQIIDVEGLIRVGNLPE